jgi:hypothetical protein
MYQMGGNPYAMQTGMGTMPVSTDQGVVRGLFSQYFPQMYQQMPYSMDYSGSDGPSGPQPDYYGSDFMTSLGFGLADIPFSPTANLFGEAILSAEIDAISKGFDNLPTTYGGGDYNAGTGNSPTGSDVSGTPF